MTPEGIEGCFLSESLNRWRDQVRAEGSPPSDRYSAFLDALLPIFQYMGAGAEMKSLAVRAWLVLRMFAPELVEHESYSSACVRFGMNPAGLYRMKDDLELAVPGLVGRKAKIKARNELEARVEGNRQRMRRIALRKAGAEFVDPGCKSRGAKK